MRRVPILRVGEPFSSLTRGSAMLTHRSTPGYIPTPLRGWEQRESICCPPMASTYTQLLYHIVFATKERRPVITPEMKDRLYPYIGGIIREERGVLYEIGGVDDHVHIYMRWRPDATLSDLMRCVKSRSSAWVRSNFVADFRWQVGYSSFSVSKSQEDAVRGYIARQVEHHAREDFPTELRRLLIAHGVEFDDQYVD